MKKNRILTMVQIALMSVFITICSYISIPLIVPFTMQTFAIYLSLLLLGSKKGTLSIILYILLGISGVPVFSSFNAGLGFLAGPTGGFVAGFMLCGVFCIIIDSHIKKPLSPFIKLSIGTLICYVTGTAHFMLSTQTDFLKALLICVIPYILPDALKLYFAYSTASKLKKIKALNTE